MVGDDLSEQSMTTITHVEWHPLSDVHVGVLTSDNLLSIFNLSHNSRVPEQKTQLTTSSRMGLLNAITSFRFGIPKVGDWSTFSVFFTTATTIHCLCPIVPLRCSIKQEYVASLLQEDSDHIVNQYFNSLCGKIQEDEARNMSFFVTEPHHSELFKKGDHTKTPSPVPLKIVFADEQLQSLVRNIVDLELIESQLLSIAVVTER